jgi:archaellum biogenesis protein FlaJ (TadC family)
MTHPIARIARRIAPLRILSATLAVVVVVGVIAAVTSHLGLAMVAVLVAQSVLFAGVVVSGRSHAHVHGEVLQKIDQASARSLADLSKVRQQIFAAVDETRPKD